MYRYNSRETGIGLRTERAVFFYGMVVRILDRVASAHERRRQRHALARLDDRMLRDIGLTGADVEAELSKPFWR